jgi:hypothetical protein
LIAGVFDVVSVDVVRLEVFKPVVKLAGTEGTEFSEERVVGAVTDSVVGITNGFS